MATKRGGGVGGGPLVLAALERSGITVAGYFWRWRPGLKGGVFPPHKDLNGQWGADAEAFGVWPREDVNGAYCQCDAQIVFRDSRGRFAKGTLD